MSSYMSLAYAALKAAGKAGTTGSLEKRVVDGLVEVGSFGGATVGELSGTGRPLRQLLNALDPAPGHGTGGSIFRSLVGGGERAFLAAVKDSLGDGLEAPDGFAFVVTDNGEYIVDDDGAYIITEEAA